MDSPSSSSSSQSHSPVAVEAAPQNSTTDEFELMDLPTYPWFPDESELTDSLFFPWSQSDSPDVVEDPPQNPATYEIEPCHTCNCHFYGDAEKYIYPSVHPWNDFVTSAQTCSYCDVIVRGCRGWLNEDGKQDWIPDSLTLCLEWASENEIPEPHGTVWKRHIAIEFAKTSIQLEILVKKC